MNNNSINHIIVSVTGVAAALLVLVNTAYAFDNTPCNEPITPSGGAGCTLLIHVDKPFPCCNTPLPGKCCARTCFVSECIGSGCPSGSKSQANPDSQSDGTCNGATGLCQTGSGGGG